MCKHDWLEKPSYGEKICSKCGRIEPCYPEPQIIGRKNGYEQIEIIRGLPVTEGTTSWRKGSIKILYSPKELHTETDLGDGHWKHLSISHPKRYPFWHEILDARYAFFDDGDTVCQILPPKSEYVNLHPNCFHLWSPIREKELL